MDETQIYAHLTDIFRDITGDEALQLTPDSSPETIKDWDSINHINIVSAAEIVFSVKFRTSDVDAMETVGDMVRIVRSRMR